MGHGDATLEQEFLHIAVAQGEVIIEPDSVMDDCTRDAVLLIALSIDWKGYVWLPIWCSMDHEGASSGP
jgi:hypothetical protein